MEWISVKDKEAPKDKPFLGYVKVGWYFQGKDDRILEIHTCIWDDFHNRFYEYCNCSGCEIDQEYIEVMYWMPLPSLPKE